MMLAANISLRETVCACRLTAACVKRCVLADFWRKHDGSLAALKADVANRKSRLKLKNDQYQQDCQTKESSAELEQTKTEIDLEDANVATSEAVVETQEAAKGKVRLLQDTQDVVLDNGKHDWVADFSVGDFNEAKLNTVICNAALNVTDQTNPLQAKKAHCQASAFAGAAKVLKAVGSGKKKVTHTAAARRASAMIVPEGVVVCLYLDADFKGERAIYLPGRHSLRGKGTPRSMQVHGGLFTVLEASTYDELDATFLNTSIQASVERSVRCAGAGVIVCMSVFVLYKYI